jgi:hypothetical protein
MPKRRKLSIEEELESAFGESLLQELATTYSAWRQANHGKCSVGEVAQALLYFVGGGLAEMGLAAQLPAKGRWEGFVADSQTRLSAAMAFCRAQMEAHQRGREP